MTKSGVKKKNERVRLFKGKLRFPQLSSEGWLRKKAV